jgi:hypothetical protein
MRRLSFVLLAAGLTTAAAGQNAGWTPAAGLSTGRVSVVRTNDVKPAVLWAGGSGGAYVSTDGGASWTLKTATLVDPVHAGVPNRVLDADRRNPDIVYAAIGGTLYRTTDGGNKWSPDPRFQEWAAPDILLTLDPAHPGDLFMEFHGYDSVCWASTASSYSSCTYPFGGTFAIDPMNPATLYAGSSPLIKSTDSGKTWKYLGVGNVSSVRVDETGTVWVGAYDSLRARVLKSTDGGATWTDLSAGLPAQQASSFPLTVGEIAVSPTNPAVLVAAVGPIWYEASDSMHPNSGFYRTVDGGAHWYRLGGHFEALTVAFAGANAEMLVGGTASNGVVTADANPPADPISIESVAPGAGSTEGGTLLMIYGSGFTPWTWVSVGGREATDFTFFDAGTIRIRTPPGAAGHADVAVHSAAGSQQALPAAFRYEDWKAIPVGAGDGAANLENGRFFVSVRWGDPSLSPGSPGQPVVLSQKSAYFWFDFFPAMEVAVKILDGRTIDGHYWIHWAALTEKAVFIQVFDKVTLRMQFYSKPAGPPAAGIDKTSF